ncbi:MAG TPA: hypothetical protein V6C76_16750 [Drouetiella sp.]
MRKRTSRDYFNVLAILLFFFLLRVMGQLFEFMSDCPLLPPMPEWQSGLIPYPVLLVFQVAIVVLFSRVCANFKNRRGFFFTPNKYLGAPLLMFAKMYFGANLVRLLIWETCIRHHQWYSGLIPITFHFVLAAFLAVVAKHHQESVKRVLIRSPYFKEPYCEI